METSENDIYKILKDNKAILFIGPTGSGKTWFIKNKLIPLIKSNSKTIQYINGYIDDQKYNKTDYIIIDEFETFLDKKYLQKIHPEEKPYYEEEYINDILKWHKSLAAIFKPTVFVLTRNEEREIHNIIQNLTDTDWGTPLTIVKHNSSKSSS